jgi:hypothetical protein
MDTSAHYCNSPDVVRAALGSIDSSQVDLQLFIRELILPDDDDLYKCDFPVSPSRYTWTESTVLIRIAKRFGHSVFEPTYKPSIRERYGPLYRFALNLLSASVADTFGEENYPFSGWQEFVRQLLEAGADPSQQTLYGTALIGVVVGAFTYSISKMFFEYTFPALEDTLRNPDKGHLALLAWLEILKNFGVDLEAYGRKEASILSSEDVEWPGREILLCRRCGLNYRFGLYLRLIGFAFGPNPKDWKFWFSDPTDQLVGEFWDMVEHPERRMPGAWDEFSW